YGLLKQCCFAALERVEEDPDVGLRSMAEMAEEQYQEFRRVLSASRRPALTDGETACIRAGLLLAEQSTVDFEVSFSHDSIAEFVLATASSVRAGRQREPRRALGALKSLVEASETSASAGNILKMTLFA